MDILKFLEIKHDIVLNEQQIAGVLSQSLNTLLLAVPGSGKTTVLVTRVANLIVNQGIDVERLLVLTYSKETAKDMRKRFISLFGELVNKNPDFRTLHSFCFMVMRYYAKVFKRTMPRLISEQEQEGLKPRVLREIYQKRNQEYLSDDMLEIVDRRISYVKNMMFEEDEARNAGVDIPSFYDVYQDYESFKVENKLIDYDDMLTYAYSILTKYSGILGAFQQMYSHVLVDEAQDTSLVQHRILEILTKNSSIFMVGDEDQSVYTFRGAYPKALLDFESIYHSASIIKMERNYRSPNDLVEKASRFIETNKLRHPKHMVSNNDKVNSIEVISLLDYKEQYAAAIELIKNNPKGKKLAVVYRNNESAIPMVDLLLQNGIKFYMKEHNLTYFNSFVMRDIIAFLRLSYNPLDIDSFRQVYYKLGLSKGVFEQVAQRIDGYKSVFACAADIPSVLQGKKDKLKYFETVFKHMRKMTPQKALKAIRQELAYDTFLNTKISDGFTRTNAYQKLNTAICLCGSTKTSSIDSVEKYLQKLDVLQDAIQAKHNIDDGADIVLSTLHSCKGLEYDTVVMIDMIKDIIPTSDAVSSQLLCDLDEIESETRLFYVGATRAKEKLIIFQSHSINGAPAKPSRFIDNLCYGRNRLMPCESPSTPVSGGETVYHTAFGEGVIESLENDVARIQFCKHGMKNIGYSECVAAGLLNVEA